MELPLAVRSRYAVLSAIMARLSRLKFSGVWQGTCYSAPSYLMKVVTIASGLEEVSTLGLPREKVTQLVQFKIFTSTFLGGISHGK